MIKKTSEQYDLLR